MWLSMSQAFDDGTSLTLPLSDLELHGAALRPDGILMDIPIVPWLYRIDAYDSILKTLQESGLRVTPLGFDWREDLMNAVRRLDHEVAGLKSRGIDRIAIVAHSMGGLIACYYLRYGAQDIRTATETWEGAEDIATVVLVGVPFGGSMSVFRNMTYGKPIGFNKTLLNFEAVSSFPGSYYLLPRSDSDTLLAADSTQRQGLIGDASNWARYHWGLLREKDGLSSHAEEKRFRYIETWLTQVRRFHDLLETPSTDSRGAGRRLLSIVGMGRSTLSTGYLNEQATGRPSIRFADDALPSQLRDEGVSLFQDGDGTVIRKASALPEGYRKQFVVVERNYTAEHIELLNRDDIQRDIVDFVVKGLASAPFAAP
jgi:pimeloyl-ACP methyl ester carboxylesterase